MENPLRLNQIPQRVGMERPAVRDVANVALEERDPARGVDRLEHQRRARAELVKRGLDQAQEVSRLEVLDYLNRDQAAERAVGDAVEKPERVALLGLEAARSARLDHRRVGVDAARGNAVFAKQIEQLAAAAPEIDDVPGAGEDRHVVDELAADLFGRAAELVFEADVGNRSEITRGARTIGGACGLPLGRRA